MSETDILIYWRLYGIVDCGTHPLKFLFASFDSQLVTEYRLGFLVLISKQVLYNIALFTALTIPKCYEHLKAYGKCMKQARNLIGQLGVRKK